MEKKKDILICLFFAFVVILFFNKFLDGSGIFGIKDLSRYFYPMRYFMVEEVKSGRIPLWNPYLFSGYPFMASLQGGFFYPLSVIFYLLPFNLAFNYYTISHYFLAAVFTYSLMRYYKIRRAGAVFSALIFAFSGYLLSVSIMNTTLSSVIWLPLSILFFDRLIKKVSFLNFLSLSLSLSLIFLGGEPSVLYSTLLLLLVYGLYFGNSLKEKSGAVIALSLSFLLFTLICAVQLLPFMELIRLSERGGAQNMKFASSYSFSVRELLNVIVPFFWGNFLDYNSFSGTNLQQWLVSPYLGFLPFFFGAFAENKKRFFFFWAGFIGLLLAFGGNTIFYHLAFNYMPGISLIRYPVKFIFLFVFSAAVLSGFGLERFLSLYLKKQSVITTLFLVPLFAFLVFDYGAVNLSINIPINKNVPHVLTPNLITLAEETSQFKYYMEKDLINLNWERMPGGEDDVILGYKDRFTSNYLVPHHFACFTGFESIVLEDHLQLSDMLNGLDINKKINILGELNVKYIASLNPLNTPKLQLIKRNDNYLKGRVYLYLNKDFMPRACILPNGTGSADIFKYSPDEIKIQTASNRSGLLFLSDSYYPGWKAYIDGMETKIYKVKCRFRAVALPEGRHQVVFLFMPASFKLGLIISSITLFLILTGWFFMVYNKRL